MTDRIAILDFGSQFTQLIARRIRDLGVFTEIYPPWNANVRQVLRACDKPAVGDGELKGIILSGGPQSIYAENAPPTCKTTCWKSACPFGHLLRHASLAAKLGGRVEHAEHHEYGLTALEIVKHNPLLPEDHLSVYMSHGDRVEQVPTGWEISASSPSSPPIAAMAHPYRKLYGLQFHPPKCTTPSMANRLSNASFLMSVAVKRLGPLNASLKKVSRKSAKRLAMDACFPA